MTIKELFNQTGLKQNWVAQKAEVSITHLNRILNEENRPSPELAVRIEEITGIDARILLGIPKPEPTNGDAV